MTKVTEKWITYSVGAGAIIIFAVLLLLRLEIPAKLFKISEKPVQVVNISRDGETWMEITQQGRKIGYAFRRREQTQDGSKFSEDIFMRINTMGVVQPVTIRTSAELKTAGELSSFRFALGSNLFQFNAAGTVADGKITVCIGEDNVKVVPISSPVYLGGGVIEAAGRGEMKQGEERTFALFDPASLSSRLVTVKSLGQETLTVMKKVVPARKLSVDFMGMKQVAWVSREGMVLREEGMLGIVLQSVSRKEALSGLDGAAGSDFTVAASIPSSTRIDDAASLKAMIVRLHDLPPGHFLLAGGRQTYKDGLLTITSEKHPGRGGDVTEDLEKLPQYLKAAPFIQSDNPKIRGKVADIVSRTDNDRVKAEKLVAWVYKNIARRPVLSIPDALQTLENRVGDCNEHAALLAALARAAGLPTEIETGLVYMRGSFFFHAWNIIYIENMGGWVTADATLNQMPTDVTHLRFARGSIESQAELAGLIGKLKLEIMRMER
jgi:hypothetical protein